MRIGIALILALMSGLGQAQNLFNRTYGAYGAFNEGKAMVELPDKDYLILGSTGGWGARNGDFAIIRTDSLGQSRWEKVFGTAGVDQAVDLQPLQDGSILMVGNTSAADGDYNALLWAMNANGDSLWSFTIGTEAWDFVRSVDQFSDGSLLVLLQTYGMPHSEGSSLMLRVATNGQLLWQQALNINEQQVAGKALITPQDSILLCSSVFNPATAGMDVHLSMWSPEGTMVWSNTMQNVEDDFVAGVCQNTAGEFFLASNTLFSNGAYQGHGYLLSPLGAVLNSYATEFGPGLSFEFRDVEYHAPSTAYLIGLHYRDNTVTRAALFKIAAEIWVQCTFVYPGTEDSSVHSVFAASDGYAIVGTSLENVPGQTSMLVDKSSTNCEFVPVAVWIENLPQEAAVQHWFPNPSESAMSLPCLQKPAKVELIGMDGRQVNASFEYHSNLLSLDVSELGSGLYVARVIDSLGKVMHQQTIVKR